MRLADRLCILGLIFALPCFGQAGRAELFGVVRDPAGLGVPKAKVQVEDQATSAHYSALADDRGEFHLIGLPPGAFVLTVEQPGFRTYRHRGIVLRTEDRISL